MGILFWMVFLIVILLLFIINLPLIRSTLQSTRLIERLTNTPASAVAGTQRGGTDGRRLLYSEKFGFGPVFMEGFYPYVDQIAGRGKTGKNRQARNRR